MYKLSIILTIMLISCATTTVPPTEIVSAEEESEPATKPEASKEKNTPEVKEHTAGELLEQGFMYFGIGRFAWSAESFGRAVGTGNLNDAGRALSYWHIAACQIELEDEDRVLDALFDFAMVSQDILDIREHRRFAVEEGADFVDSFELVSKLAWARAYINFTWASRDDKYGRTLTSPILAYNIKEIDFFAEQVEMSCSGECDFQRALLYYEDDAGEKPHTEVITIRGQDNDRFFIVIPNADNNNSQ